MLCDYNQTNETTLSSADVSKSQEKDEAIELLNQIVYIYLAFPILIIGIAGNILNLITLQNRNLRTEPFMYVSKSDMKSFSALFTGTFVRWQSSIYWRC